MAAGSFGVGERVRCSNSMVGICQFIGTIEHKQGIWVGIDLGGEPAWRGKGKNSGSVNGVVYFDCQPLCGIFFPIAKVSPANDSQPAPRTRTSSAATPRPTKQQRPSLPPPPLLSSSTTSYRNNLNNNNNNNNLNNSNNSNNSNNLTKSTSKRASVTATTIRPSSRTALKRPESVNSHHARTATPEWARQRRPSSRLSIITPTPPPPPPPPPPQLPTTSPEQLIELQQRILQLESDLNQKNQQEELTNRAQHELTQNNNQLHEQLATLNKTCALSQETATQQAAQFEKERSELQNQLHQLRSAGQSLCGVYENKISDLEELRLEQQHKSELLAEELKATKLTLEELLLHKNTQNHPKSSPSSPPPNRSSHLQAIEIDNESLRADLKYTQERLSEVQDEAYQLKQELAHEREAREELAQTHQQTHQQQIKTIKTVREELSLLDREKAELQERLGQAESRLKETGETMEQERAELEALRADHLLASSSHPHPNNKHQLESEMTHPNSNNKHQEIIKEKQARIDFLEAQLNRYSSSSSSDQSKTNISLDSQPIMDQEKMLVIQKYQRLLLVKDEENLKLLAKLEELEEELGHPMTKARPIKNHSPARLRHKTSTQSLTRSSPRPHNHHIIMARSVSCTTIDEQASAGELARANQQIVGLKVIARQANEERSKLEKITTELKEEVEELKRDNRVLEQKLAGLVKPGKTACPSSSRMRSETIGPTGRKYSLQQLGIENEVGLLTEIGNHQPQSGSSTPMAARDHQAPTGDIVLGDYRKVRKLEAEVDALKSQLVLLDSKHARDVEALNKEVSELEAIIESKIFQEEALEEEVERLTERLQRLAAPDGRPGDRGGSERAAAPERERALSAGAGLHRRSSKTWRRRPTAADPGPAGPAPRFSGLRGLAEEEPVLDSDDDDDDDDDELQPPDGPSGPSSSVSVDPGPSDEPCELCDRPGHQLDTCPIFATDI